jgi:hypothetical protein
MEKIMNIRPVVNDLHTLYAFLKTDSKALSDLHMLNSAMKTYDVNPNFPTPGPSSPRFQIAESLSVPAEFNSHTPIASPSRIIDYYARRIANKTGAILWVWSIRQS